MLKKVCLFCLIAVSLMSFSACNEQIDYLTHSGSVFSSDIVFSVDVAGENAQAAIDEMISVLNELDGQINATIPTSDVARLNASPVSTKIEIGERTYILLEQSKKLYLQTDQAFNVCAGQLSELWHVDIEGINTYKPTGEDDFSHPESLPEYAQAAALGELCTPNAIEISKENLSFYALKVADTKVDLGGIAKGYAADLCKEICEKHQVISAKIDIGGNLYFYGKFNGDDGRWRIGVKNPRPLIDYFRQPVCAFTVTENVSVVTSGDYERFYYFPTLAGRISVPHIIGGNAPYNLFFDGKDWCEKDEWVVSCTVVGQSSLVCDALATAVCVKGLTSGSAMLEEVGYSGIIFTNNQKFAIVGDIELFQTNVYDGYKQYTEVTV